MFNEYTKRFEQMKIIRLAVNRESLRSRFVLRVLSLLGFLVLVQVILPERFQLFCPFMCWGGFPCPSCGATRCIQWILTGSPVAAVRMNPLVFFSVFLIGGWLVSCAASIWFKIPMLHVEFETFRERVFVGFCFVLVIAANWIYLIHWR